ncbi:hypothetical protein CASFOL_040956 [Castilleja foliolosa]|uniref:Uncharacterized protein n=1 Tax=Castilleja foliolosa TaxID=1961234 RepID=A0ABD3BEQ1_9LAMI
MARFILAMLVVAILLSSTAEATNIGYPALSGDHIWIKDPPTPANPWTRPCTEAERCKRDGRKLLNVKRLPNVSMHGLQDGIIRDE